MKKFEIRAIVFDLDGTLVDSQLDFDLMKAEIGIPQNEPILEYLENHHDKNFVNKAFDIIHRHEVKGANLATCIADSDKFIQYLNQKDFPLGVLTRNSSEVTELTLKKYDWKFLTIFTRDNAKAKPHPDALFEFSKISEIDIENIFYIGDHAFDIETARNAGCIAGLIANKHNSHLSQLADITLTHFHQLDPYIR
jgi:HAD superfamily hydrolase (TIGR01549 family)